MTNNDNNIFRRIGELTETLNSKVGNFAHLLKDQGIEPYDYSDIANKFMENIEFEPNPLIELAKLQYEELKSLNNEIKDLKDRLDQVEVDKVKQEKKNKTFQWILGLTITFVGAVFAYLIALIL